MTKKTLLGLALAAAIVLWPNVALSAPGDLFSNLVKNPGFEEGKANWVNSAGSFTLETSAVGSGARAGKFNASAASQALLGTAVAVPASLKGKNCILVGYYKLASVAASYKFQAYDGTNVLAESATLPIATEYTKIEVPFVCPSSGNVQPRVISDGDGADFYLDDVNITLNPNIGSAAQPQLLGTATVTGCASYFGTTSGSFTDITQTGCAYAVTGSVLAPDTMWPGLKVATVQPGEYRLEAEGLFISISNDTYLQAWDGTNTFREVSTFYASGGNFPSVAQTISYSTGQGATNFRFRMKTDSGSQGGIHGTTIHPLVLRLYYYPPSQQVVKPDLQPALASIKWTPSSTGAVTANSASWTTFSDAMYSTNKTYKGNVTQEAVNDIRMTVNAVPAGDYMLIYSGPMAAYRSGSSSTECSFRIYDGTTDIARGLAQGVPSNDFDTINGLVGTVKYSSPQSSVTYYVQGYRYAGDGSCLHVNDDTAGRSHELMMIPLTQSLPMPQIVNSLTTSTLGQERIERVVFAGSCSGAVGTANCTSSPCTICTQSGSWVSSVTRSGTGTYTINFAQAFSAAPVCLVNPNSVVGSGYLGSASSTSTTTATVSTGTTSAAADGIPAVICMGPR